MNAVERRIACGCEQQTRGIIGGADGGRTHDLRIANALQPFTQVAVRATNSNRLHDVSSTAFTRSGAAASCI
jgi:hypothetical protein